MSKISILESIRNPCDLKGLSLQEIATLSNELRERIISVVSRNGGHLASSLGVVEFAIALHRVFDSPQDAIVWDVGHQSYAHKLLTGRARSFSTLRQRGGISGFPKFSECEHDAFGTGHASTSISAALGILTAKRLRGESGAAIAIIGDGALTGGLAYEALSHAGQLQLPLIVILNDNKMSISPNVGAISKYLSRLTMKARYQGFRRLVDSLVRRIPVVGEACFRTIVKVKKGIKAIFYPENFFVDLGFEYVGPIDGHRIPMLEEVLRDVKRLNKPVVLHVITRKGKGFEQAEDDPSSFHGVSPFSITDGLVERTGTATFTEAFAQAACSLASRDDRVVAITAAMEKGTGLSAFKKQFPSRFFDVGIAEAHELAFAAGLAIRGLRPLVAVYSTFAQRAVDQIIHDIALQDLPVIIAMDRAGFVPDDGETHQGLFDIGLFKSVPNLVLLSPATSVELNAMLGWSLAQQHPVLIRYPKADCPAGTPLAECPLEEGRGALVRRVGSNILLLCTGGQYPQTQAAVELLTRHGLSCDLYNMRFLKPLDKEYLLQLLSGYELVVSIEDGMLSGGIGETISALMRAGELPVRFLSLGASDAFFAQASRAELMQACGLDADGIAASVERFAVRMGLAMTQAVAR